MNQQENAPAFTRLINLAAERFGAKVLWCTDDFFAEKENLIKPEKPIFIPEKFTERGKWMDGWESRRKRTEGHDIVVIQLGAAGIIKGFDVDTSHFLGNQPEYCTIEACYAPDGDWEKATWVEVLGKTMLNPGSQHFLEVDSVRTMHASSGLATHVKLHIHPDGGVARLRVYGEVQRDWSGMGDASMALHDLASAQNGALAVQCNDMFFSHMNNLLMPGRGVNMGDGWETKRNRTPNNCDWVIVRLAHKGILKKALIDTAHFKGNYPDSFTLEGCSIETTAASTHRVDPQAEAAALANAKWSTLIERSKLQAHHEHQYEKELVCKEPVSHVRLNIFPDGGVSRIRLWGTIV